MRRILSVHNLTHPDGYISSDVLHKGQILVEHTDSYGTVYSTWEDVTDWTDDYKLVRNCLNNNPYLTTESVS